MKIIAIAILTLGWSFGLCLAAETPKLANQTEEINYSIGYQIGSDFLAQGVSLSPAAMIRGIEDALGRKQPRLSAAQMHQTLAELKSRIVAGQRSKAEGYRGDGREFLAVNAKKEGVVELPSGLQYEVLRQGSGRSPQGSDRVRIQYRGLRLDGQVFSSSYQDGKATEMPVDQGVPGFAEALQLMQEGAKWRLFIPADLAFGEKGPLADQTVIFEVELLKIL